jgi:hypothetical protein
MNGTETNSKIIMLGCDWDPTILYFAKRKGLMLTQGRFDSEILNKSFVNAYQYLYTCGEQDLSILPSNVKLADQGNNLFKIIN